MDMFNLLVIILQILIISLFVLEWVECFHRWSGGTDSEDIKLIGVAIFVATIILGFILLLYFLTHASF
jgi:hypothetical protein